MSTKLLIDAILAESEQEVGRFAWEGSFADYLRMVIQNPSLSRLSHSLVHDAILAEGMEVSPEGEPSYGLFQGEMFGLEADLDRIVQYLDAAAQRMEVRKRILLLLGPPASGKSTVVDLIKRALERYTRTDAGAVYTIDGCPMQEEPLHLIPTSLRPVLMEQYGVYVEGDLCPRCRYALTDEHDGKVAEVPVKRVLFSEKEAIGIGYYLATNPNPTDATLLVGSVDESKLDADRLEVAGKAFRLDGELNIANRGMIEFVEMFKADRHMLTTLLGLAQELLIKLQKFGSVYADEVIFGHSNEGDFETFADEATSEALRDRIIAIQIPYNLKVSEEVKIYEKMMVSSEMQDVHIAPLTLRLVSIFATLFRLEPPARQGMSVMDKLHLYDGQMVRAYSKQDVQEMHRHHPKEGMQGVSPRYVMNRLGAASTAPDVSCISPLASLDSLWQGLSENVSLDWEDAAKYVELVSESVKEYSALAIREVQNAYDESFEQTATMLLDGYLYSVAAFSGTQGQDTTEDEGEGISERDMREIERAIGIAERDKTDFRHEINRHVLLWKQRGLTFHYTSEPRIQAAIESRLFPAPRALERGLTQPRFARQRVEWAGRRNGIAGRLMATFGYCPECAEDVINFATHVLKNRTVVKTPKGEGVEWFWPLNPGPATWVTTGEKDQPETP